MKKIFAKYKWLLIALLMISIIAIPMVVNVLFKFSSAFPAEWSAGDALSYVSGLQTSLDKGTQRKTTENELPSLTQCTA